MNTKFFDRKNEQDSFRKISKGLNQCSKFLMVKGHPGSGKTSFLTHVLEKNNIYCFELYNKSKLIKCWQNEAEKEYCLILKCLSTIQKEDPKFFSKFSVNFYNKINDTSGIEIAGILASRLKAFGFQNVIKHSLKKVQDSVKSVNIFLTETQLCDFFSDLFIAYCQKKYNNYVVLCVDDFQWIDDKSKMILIDIMQKLKGKDDFHFSLFVTQRDYNSLSKSEVDSITTFLKDIYQCIDESKVIEITNFDIQTTEEYLRDNDLLIFQKNIRKIFNLTKGNPQELYFSSMYSDKISENEIQRLENKSDYLNNSALLSTEIISNIIHNNTLESKLLKILAIVESSMFYNDLVKISEIVFKINFSTVDFNYAIESLLTHGAVVKDHDNHYEISHDTTREIIINILNTNNEYFTFASEIAKYYYSLFKKLNNSEKEFFLTMSLLSKSDTILGFKYFAEQFNQEDLDINSCVLGAKCFCSDISNFTVENLNSKVMQGLLIKLVSYAEIKTTKKLCKCLMVNRTKIKDENMIPVLICYIKSQIDTSIIINDEHSAINLLNLLLDINIVDINTRFEVYLLAMSTYEHIMDIEKIRHYYEQATNILCDDIRVELKSIYYRNKGLVIPHQNLFDSYNKSVYYSEQIQKSNYSCLIEGTCLNNLGLAYIYSNNPDEALKKFNEALRLIKFCGYDASRVYNNIGVTYCLMKDYHSAREVFGQALKLQKNDPFMKKGILGNMALALYQTGNKSESNQIIDGLVSEYYQQENIVSDTVVYCSALVNKGFFDFSDAKYSTAEKYYSDSLFHKYRSSEDKHYTKRMEMIKAAQKYANNHFDYISSIDLNDVGTDIFMKPYSLVPFAFYVI